MKYRWIVSPNILEITTDQPILNGFFISRFKKDYNDFLSKLVVSSRNNYSFIIDNICIPDDPDAIYGYYSFKDNIIYYSRSIGSLKFKFSYDIKKSIMVSNYLLSKLPFECGHIWPPALNLAHIISLDLLIKDNILIMDGAVVKVKNKTYCIMGPSMAGKTTLTKYFINNNKAKYMAEEKFLTDGTNIFSVSPFNYGNFDLRKLGENTIFTSNIDSIIFLAKKEILTKEIDVLLNVYSTRLFGYSEDSFAKVLQFFGLYDPRTINIRRSAILNRLKNINFKFVSIDHKEKIEDNISKIFGDDY